MCSCKRNGTQMCLAARVCLQLSALLGGLGPGVGSVAAAAAIKRLGQKLRAASGAPPPPSSQQQ